MIIFKKKLKNKKNILGGKGANLGEMGRLGLPVPPGFTITTDVCDLFYKNKKKLPKKVIQKISEADKSDKELLGHLLLVAKKITDENDIKDFRLVINNGAEAGQTVFHLHIHILAGRAFGWPPG